MELEVGAKILEVVVIWQLVRYVLLQGHGSLICPAAGNIPDELGNWSQKYIVIIISAPDCVASTSEQHQWEVVSLHKLHTLGVTLQCQVKAAQSVIKASIDHS